MVDPIADMLNRIRNAQAVLKETVDFPFSNLKYEIAKILEKSGFVKKVEKKKNNLEISLKYENKIPVISGLKRISKSGQRIYASWQEIKKIKGGYGLAVVSTSRGLMTDKEARKQKLGGEVLCKIW